MEQTKTNCIKKRGSRAEKILSLLLSFAMLLSITTGLDLSAFAETSGDFEYELLDDGTAEITEYTGSAADLTIPSTLDDYTVTSIGYGTFEGCTSLTSVTIPDSVTSIDDYAFEGCTSLTGITVDEDNQYYSSQDGLLFNKDKTELIQYPTGNTRTLYTIPDSVTSIGYGTFEGCTSLTSVTIPDSVTTIGEWAFEGCTSLTSVTIPDSVTTIGEWAFEGCTSLTGIIVDEDNQYYSSQDGVLFNKDKTELIQYPAGNTRTLYTIPDSVTSIDLGAFEYSESLTDVTIGNSVTSIGDNAFTYCTSLTDITVDEDNQYYSSQDGVLFNKDKTELIQYPAGNTRTLYTIPDSVTSIDDYAFEGCTSLTSVTIPDSVTSIGWCAFEGCTSLASVTIPDSVTSIYDYAFESCESLTDVYYTGTEDDWNNISINPGNECLTDAQLHYLAVNKIETVEIQKTTFGNNWYYTGNTITPTVTVKDSTGKTLKRGTDYSLTYDSPRSDVGRYNIKVTFKGNYSGTKTLTYDIVPRATTITSVVGKSHGFTVRWNKNTTQSSGYEIQYSTASSLANAATIDVKSNTNYARSVTGRLANKTYYVRLRVYTDVEYNGKTVRVYSPWTSVSSVKTGDHSYESTSTVTPATQSADGKLVTVSKCSGCSAVKSTSTKKIAKVATVQLQKTTFGNNWYYTGKTITPTVTVKDSTGKALKRGTDYSLTYDSARTKVGRYNIKVTFKGNYSGTKTLTYDIVPRATTITSVVGKSHGFTVRWNKNTTQSSGYEIQYSTASSLANAATIDVKSNTNYARSVTGRLANKTYYVRLRVYTNVKYNGKTVRVYSPWTAVKSVKTK